MCEQMASRTTTGWIKLMRFGHYCGCHQMPERSFFIGGYQFPLCARCTGMLIGEIITYLLFALKIIISPIIALVLLGIMGLDWSIQFLGVSPSTNLRRLFSGIAGGVGIVSLFLHYLFIFLRKCNNRDWYRNNNPILIRRKRIFHRKNAFSMN